MKTLICTLFIAIGFFAFSQNDTKFDQGTEHYKEANYEAAISAWETILEASEHSEALYFNLGNAYFRINQIGPSIYFYEKALLLAPNDTEIKNNLKIAQASTVDIIEPMPKSLVLTWIEKNRQLFNFNGWAKTSILFICGFTFLFILYYFSNSSLKKRILFTGSLLSLCISLVSLLFAFSSYNKVVNSDSAIVFATSTQVRSEPLQRSEISFVLHEGTKVKITDTVEGWNRVELADGKEGWMPKDDLKKLSLQ